MHASQPKRGPTRTAFSLLLLLLLVPGAFAMSAFGKEKVLFSPVSGVVLDGDTPVTGAVIRRSCEWTDEKREDTATTDAAGEFTLDAVTVKSLMWSLIPHSPEIFQTLEIQVGDQTYTAWSFQKGDYDLNSETGGRPLRMRCNIQNEADVHDISALFSYFGICTLE